MWSNPYDNRDARSQRAQENRLRVQRRREEREFMKGMQTQYELKHIADVRERMKETDEMRVQDHHDRIHQSRSVSAALTATLPENDAPQVEHVARFDCTARCFAVTQGGATIWTGEQDGTIGIRNGCTGAVSYALDKTDGAVVDVLFATAAYVWVGLSDGSVRVYDHLVYILAMQGRPHTDAVSAFADTFDGKMFSASVDGSIVKWDSDANDFDQMLQLPKQDTPVFALATYGYNLFIAGEADTIRCMDTESGAHIKTFAGHEGPVRSVIVADGYLFSAGDDASVRVWSIDEEAEVHCIPHGAAVTTLLPDQQANAVWTADLGGNVKAFSTKATTTFAQMRSFVLPDNAGVPVGPGQSSRSQSKPEGPNGADEDEESGEAPGIVLLYGMSAVDATKMWSVGSNGNNYVWHCGSNKIEAATRQAVMAMDHIIDQDSKELDRWQSLLDSKFGVSDRLAANAAVQLALDTDRSRMLAAFRKWLWWRIRHRASRKPPIIAVLLRNTMDNFYRSAAYVKWYEWARRTQIERGRRSTAETLMIQTTESHRRLAFMKWTKFAATQLARKRKQRAAEMMLSSTTRGLQLIAYKRLCGYRDVQLQAKRREALARGLAATTGRLLVSVYFSNWAKIAEKQKRRTILIRQAECLEGYSDRGLLRQRYAAWSRFVQRRRQQHTKAKIVHAMSERVPQLHLYSRYKQWEAFTLDRMTKSQETESERLAREIEEVQAQLDAMAHIVCRRTIVTEAQALIEAAEARVAKKRADAEALSAKLDEMEATMEAKKAAATERREATMEEQIRDLMGRLKAKVLNFHSDFPLITKTVDRSAKSGVPVQSQFLEAHAAVKRQVVDLTGAAYLKATEEWPLTQGKVKKMKSHMAEAVLSAIKVLVITWDMMTPEDRDNLETDEEIMINAMWLECFADTCNDMKKKRLRR